MKRRKQIFTLIELLIVVAIIAILAAMLLPALNKARMSAQKISCTSNVKQIGLAMQSYNNDNDGMMPPAGWQNGSNYLLWPNMVSTYMGLKQVANDWGALTGKNLPQKSAFFCSTQIDKLGGNRFYMSYGYNMCTFGGVNYAVAASYNGVAKPPPPVKNTQIKRPSKQMVFAEAWYNTTTDAYRSYGRYTLDFQNYVCFRHLKTANTGYLDGHAAAENQDVLYMSHPLGYPWNWCLQNKDWFVYPGRANWSSAYGYSPYQ